MNPNPKANYILTYFCSEDFDYKSALENAFKSGKYETVCGQLERGSKSGKIHLQGYVKCTPRLRGTQVLKDFPKDTFFKAEKDWQKDAKNCAFRMQQYSIKEKTRISPGFTLLGTPQKNYTHEIGSRGGCARSAKYKEARQLAREGKFLEIDDEVYIRHMSSLKRIHIEEGQLNLIRPEFCHVLRGWQEQLMEEISKPDGRTVWWLHDDLGGAGKSTFCAWYSMDQSVFFMQGGSKKSDVMFQLSAKHTTLFIDIPRVSTYRPYELVEIFLTGHWRHQKYEGGYVNDYTFKRVAVIFSNKYPTISAFSPDRWKIYSIIDNRLVYIDPSSIINELNII